LLVKVITTTEFYAVTFPIVYSKLDSLWSWHDKPYKVAQMGVQIIKKFGTPKPNDKGALVWPSDLDERVQESQYEISDDIYNCIANLIKVEKLKLIDKLPPNMVEEEDTVAGIEATLVAVAFADTIGK
jgi:hypothetical protein